MIIFEIEKSRQELIRKLQLASSPRQVLFILKDFFDQLMHSDYSLNESYFLEFIEKYLECLKNYEPFYIHPKYTKEILLQANTLKNISVLSNFKVELIQSSINLERKLSKLKDILESKIQETERAVLFPVLETHDGQIKTVSLGLLESLTIKIQAAKRENKFIVVPSAMEIEERISNQINISWNLALKFIKKYLRKVNPYHEVIIQFDKRFGFYIGESLGIALTIGFIEQLLYFYNSTSIINIRDNISVTGGIDKDGKVKKISTEIIKQKVETVFFSPTQIFVVPIEGELEAKVKVEEFNKEYPNKKLEIIGVENLNDIFNRRNLIDIRKQNPIVRTTKGIRKHWLGSIALSLLLLLVGFLLFYNLDDNPTFVYRDERNVYVKNKFGKILWTKISGTTNPITKPIQQNTVNLIIDIENDGVNEVLITAERLSERENIMEHGILKCYNFDGSIKWIYTFNDSVKTKREIFTEDWNSPIMLSIVNINGKKTLICSIANYPSFADAIFKIDLLTVKRTPGTLWHPGHIGAGFVKDLNNDGKQVLIAVGCNNSFNHVGSIFVLPVDSINGYSPSTDEYRFYEFPKANFQAYISIPQTDYCKYLGVRNSWIIGRSFADRKDINKIFFGSGEYTIEDMNKIGIQYYLDYNLKDFDITPTSSFAWDRDKLVIEKKLSPPLTDTEEFRELIKSQIKYWNGKDFVKREDLK